MTIINRICPEAADILAIRLECNHCHATISYPPATWKPSYLKCPNCSVTLVNGTLQNLSDELSALWALAEGLQGLLKAKNAEFRLRFEFDQQD
jgi:hypothetical protein